MIVKEDQDVLHRHDDIVQRLDESITETVDMVLTYQRVLIFAVFTHLKDSEQLFLRLAHHDLSFVPRCLVRDYS